MKHPHCSKITRDFALNLARNLKYGPLPAKLDPLPGVDEAIKIIHDERATCGFNWITGTYAEEVLRMSRGEKVKLS
jgi:hypothetical protein